LLIVHHDQQRSGRGGDGGRSLHSILSILFILSIILSDPVSPPVHPVDDLIPFFVVFILPNALLPSCLLSTSRVASDA
jgi:hypothetical protein